MDANPCCPPRTTPRAAGALTHNAVTVSHRAADLATPSANVIHVRRRPWVGAPATASGLLASGASVRLAVAAAAPEAAAEALAGSLRDPVLQQAVYEDACSISQQMGEAFGEQAWRAAGGRAGRGSSQVDASLHTWAWGPGKTQPREEARRSLIPWSCAVERWASGLPGGVCHPRRARPVDCQAGAGHWAELPPLACGPRGVPLPVLLRGRRDVVCGQSVRGDDGGGGGQGRNRRVV